MILTLCFQKPLFEINTQLPTEEFFHGFLYSKARIWGREQEQVQSLAMS